MQAHPKCRPVIVGAVALRAVEGRCDRRTAAAKNLSPSARRKGDLDVPFRILSTATLRIFFGVKRLAPNSVSECPV